LFCMKLASLLFGGVGGVVIFCDLSLFVSSLWRWFEGASLPRPSPNERDTSIHN